MSVLWHGDRCGRGSKVVSTTATVTCDRPGCTARVAVKVPRSLVRDVGIIGEMIRGHGWAETVGGGGLVSQWCPAHHDLGGTP